MALKGVRVVELDGMAPVPYAGLLLAQLGADVVRVERKGGSSDYAQLGFGKRSVVLDLKDAAGRAALLALAARADVLLDPYRPGVLERLGFGPDELQRVNPRLVIARLTGYGHVRS